MKPLRWLPILLLCPQAAMAHGSLPGGGGFYAGLSHPFLAWEHLILLIGLGLLVGQRGRIAGHPPLAALTVGLVAGLIFGAGTVASPFVVPILLLSILCGAFLVLAWLAPTALLACLALVAGLSLGYDTGMPVAASPAFADTVMPYVGVTVGVMLAVLNAMALSSVAEGFVARIGLRIAGSWIIAATAMVLALRLGHVGGIS